MNVRSQDPLYSKERIEEIVIDVAMKINKSYEEERKPIVLVGVLNGAIPFLADLMRHIHVPCQVDTIRVESYVGQEQGEIAITSDTKENLEGKKVILVEDIVDTGNTMRALINKMHTKSMVEHVAIATLFKRHSCDLECHFVCEVIADDAFIYGYGLDAEGGLNRNLDEIWIEK